jgi:hypothetical protein
MKKTPSKSTATAESIAQMADKGKNVSRFFTNAGRKMSSVQRVNVDFTASMLDELDREAKELNVSRQAVIKTLLRRALDEHYMAVGNRMAMK